MALDILKFVYVECSWKDMIEWWELEARALRGSKDPGYLGYEISVQLGLLGGDDEL